MGFDMGHPPNSNLLNLCQVPELEFGNMMALWSVKGTYPLEAVSLIRYEDKDAVFWQPAVMDYGSLNIMENRLTTGCRDGYTTREQALRCIGRCWDKAEADTDKTVSKRG